MPHKPDHLDEKMLKLLGDFSNLGGQPAPNNSTMGLDFSNLGGQPAPNNSPILDFSNLGGQPAPTEIGGLDFSNLGGQPAPEMGVNTTQGIAGWRGIDQAAAQMPQQQTGTSSYSGTGPANLFSGANLGMQIMDFVSQIADQTGGNTGSGGGGGGGSIGSNVSYSDIYDNLAQSTRDLFGDLESTDFTQQIQNLAEQGRIDIEDMNSEQMQFLSDAFDRRISQINEIGSDLSNDLRVLDTAGSAEMAGLAQLGEDRRAKSALAETERLNAQRAELGEQVSSEFEEIAALTAGLRGSTAESSAAAMDRLRVVSRMAAQERLAMPAKLVAQAQLAVGDEKFRLENQIQQSTSDALRQLNAREREQVLGEAQRLAQEGYAQDMALAQALQGVEQQRAQTYIQEENRRRSAAAAAQAAAARGEEQRRDDMLAAQLLGVPVEMYKVMPTDMKNELWENAYSPNLANEKATQQGKDMRSATLAGVSYEQFMLMEPWEQEQAVKDGHALGEQSPPINTFEGLLDIGYDNTTASLALGMRQVEDNIAEATAQLAAGIIDQDAFNAVEETRATYMHERGITKPNRSINGEGTEITSTGQKILSAVDIMNQGAPYQAGGFAPTGYGFLGQQNVGGADTWATGGAKVADKQADFSGAQIAQQAYDNWAFQ